MTSEQPFANLQCCFIPQLIFSIYFPSESYLSWKISSAGETAVRGWVIARETEGHRWIFAVEIKLNEYLPLIPVWGQNKYNIQFVIEFALWVFHFLESFAKKWKSNSFNRQATLNQNCVTEHCDCRISSKSISIIADMKCPY